jgi:hypothetical protein
MNYYKVQNYGGKDAWWFTYCGSSAKPNFQYLCDIEVVMGLACIMFLLESVHALIKFAQAYDTFVCGFVIVVKMCCAKLYNMYFDLKKIWCRIVQSVFGPTWKQQWPIVDCFVDWFCNKHLVCGFLFHGQAIQLHKKCFLIRVFTQATCDDWTSTFEIVKV